MTVAELIAELQKMPQDAEVMRVEYDVDMAEVSNVEQHGNCVLIS